MDWIQTFSIIFTVVVGAYYIHRDIKEDMKTQTARTDRLYEMFIDLKKEQTSRTDRLYEMFIDLIKESKK